MSAAWQTATISASGSPWLTAREAARWARCGIKVIYREVEAGRLRASRIGGRRELRFLAEWVDDWLLRTATPVDVGATITPRSSRPQEG